MTDDEIIDRISTIRAKNNIPWMKVVQIALRHAPEETREVLGEILANDMMVCKQVRNLITGDNLV
jgi:hypothetical protein